jgi:biotin carboxyl carrier protein
MMYQVNVDGREYSVELKRSAQGANVWVCTVNSKRLELDAIRVADGVLSILIEGRNYEIKRDLTASGEHLSLNGRAFQCEVRDPRALRGRRSASDYAEGPKRITAPMPGKVVRVVAAAGTEVEVGQGVIVIEAMKMQNELKSPKKGKVQKIVASEGAAVNAGDTLAIIE